MFIIYSALPTYQMQLGKKAPSYKKLTAHRQQRQKAVGAIPKPEEDYWREILGGAENA